MNGGFSGGANDNEDWLISDAAINLSAMTNPTLSFWMETYYSGMTSKNVMVSTNYIGSGDPSAAIWTSIKDVTSETPATWTQYNNISLSAYQATPFYLAFKYNSYATSNGAQEWSLDDITTVAGNGNPNAINETKAQGMGLAVLGNATSNQILLGVTLKENGPVNISVFDATGRRVYDAKANMQIGMNQYRIQNVNLTKGLYVIHVSNATHSGVVKTTVQ